MKEEMEVFDMVLEMPDGSWRNMSVLVGRDKSLWVEPSYLGLDAKAVERLRRQVRAGVRNDPVTGRTYVEARAVIEDCKSPEKRAELERFVPEFVEMLLAAQFP